MQKKTIPEHRCIFFYQRRRVSEPVEIALAATTRH